VLAGKYQALPPVQGLKLSELSASHKNPLKAWQIFKYLVITLAINVAFMKELKCSLKSGNTCYCLVQNLLFSIFILKNMQIEICRSAILPVILYRLREEHRLRVFEEEIWA
jgi:hypothetical protein